MTRSNVLRWTRETALTVGAVVGVTCVLIAIAALVFGVKPLVFESGSMGPQIDTGALGVAVSTPADELGVGDVVSVTNDAGDRITHRIVGMNSNGEGDAELTLRGDANASPDAQTYRVSRADRLLFSVNGLGYVVDALQSPAAIFAGGLLVGVLLMVAFGRGGRQRETDRAHAGGPPNECTSSSSEPKHKSASRRGTGVVAVGALLGLLIPLGVADAHGTKAAYTDPAAASAQISATTIGAATGSCAFNPILLGGNFVITWKFPANHGYSVPANVEFERSKTSGLGGILEPIDAGSITTKRLDTGEYETTVSSSLLGGILGGQFNFGITVIDSGWRSKTVRAEAYVGPAGLSGRCDSAFL